MIYNLSREWANGGYTGETIDQTIQLNSAAIGKTIQLRELVELTYEELSEGLKDNE